MIMSVSSERCVQLAQYMLDKKCTVRAAAKHFGISKSTVHSDITDRLPSANKALYEQIRDLLNENWEAKALRGGMACYNKYYANRKRTVKRKKRKALAE